MPASLTARLAWLVPGSLFAVATLGWGTITLVDLSAHERHHEQQEFTAPIRTLDINNDKGHVRIIGTDTSTVTVDASVSEGLRSGSHSEQVEGDRLVIRATCPTMLSTWCGVDYTIRVPAATAVVSHSSDEDVDVTGVTGDLELSSSDGNVRVSGGGGHTLTLHSSDGNITGAGLTAAVVTASSSDGNVRLSFAQPPQTVKVDTTDGNITVEVPDTPGAYHVEAHSTDGGIHTDVRTDPNGANLIQASSSDGSVTIRYPAG
jgi:hypothetical protein